MRRIIRVALISTMKSQTVDMLVKKVLQVGGLYVYGLLSYSNVAESPRFQSWNEGGFVVSYCCSIT